MIDRKELEDGTRYALQVASKTIVTSDDDYAAAGNARKHIKYIVDQIKTYWAPKKDQAYQLHKTLVASEKEMLDPLVKADKDIDTRMSDYRREVERQRQEAEAARRKAEEEARRKAEDARRLAEEAALKDELEDEDVEILRMAQQEADEASFVAPVIVHDVAKVDGISVRKTWKARVIAEYKVPVAVAGITIRPIDTSALNKLAALSGGKAECPGVEFYQEETTQVRLR